jgi:hypothetical protein
MVAARQQLGKDSNNKGTVEISVFHVVHAEAIKRANGTTCERHDFQSHETVKYDHELCKTWNQE